MPPVGKRQERLVPTMSQSELRRHNETVLEELEPGDLIEFNRGLYSHWAVYYGEGQVIHLAGDANDGLNANVNSGSLFTICGRQFNKAFVKIDEFWDVVLESKACKNNKKDKKLNPKSPQQIVEDALSMIGQIGYNVLWKNCEHFASHCRYGVEKSDQARNFLTWTIGGLAAGIAGIAMVSKHKTNKQ